MSFIELKSIESAFDCIYVDDDDNKTNNNRFFHRKRWQTTIERYVFMNEYIIILSYDLYVCMYVCMYVIITSIYMIMINNLENSHILVCVSYETHMHSYMYMS